ncbi:MAG: DUF3050 domain-containing protein [Planctomycetaceae bacterium]
MSSAPLAAELAGSAFDLCRRSLEPIRAQLLDHRLHRELTRPAAVQVFMEHHIFAVWDFMSLAKSLQRTFTCVTLPWVPPAHSSAARLINDIVLEEETDLDPEGRPSSHFELYLAAMQQFGANTDSIHRLVAGITQGTPWRQALAGANPPAPAVRFVTQTLELVERNRPAELAAALALGREDLLPDLFRQMISRVSGCSGGRLSRFEYYLDRHIELDGGKHGNASSLLLLAACGRQPDAWEMAERAARHMLLERLAFWDGIAAAIDRLPRV